MLFFLQMIVMGSHVAMRIHQKPALMMVARANVVVATTLMTHFIASVSLLF